MPAKFRGANLAATMAFIRALDAILDLHPSGVTYRILNSGVAMVKDKQSIVFSLSSPSKAETNPCRSPREDVFNSVPGNGANYVITISLSLTV